MKVRGYRKDKSPLPELQEKLRRLLLPLVDGYVVLILKDEMGILDHGGRTEEYEEATAHIGALFMDVLLETEMKEEGECIHIH